MAARQVHEKKSSLRTAPKLFGAAMELRPIFHGMVH
jgi:hypothetical protein